MSRRQRLINLFDLLAIDEFLIQNIPSIPSGINKDILEREIVRICGEHHPVYQDTIIFKYHLQTWFQTHHQTIKKLLATVETEYNILYNYYMTEEIDKNIIEENRKKIEQTNTSSYDRNNRIDDNLSININEIITKTDNKSTTEDNTSKIETDEDNTISEKTTNTRTDSLKQSEDSKRTDNLIQNIDTDKTDTIALNSSEELKSSANDYGGYFPNSMTTNNSTTNTTEKIDETTTNTGTQNNINIIENTGTQTNIIEREQTDDTDVTTTITDENKIISQDKTVQDIENSKVESDVKMEKEDFSKNDEIKNDETVDKKGNEKYLKIISGLSDKTTNQELIQKEREIALFNIYNWIAIEIDNNLFLSIY